MEENVTSQASSPAAEDQTIDDQTSQETQGAPESDTEEILEDNSHVDKTMSEGQRKAFQEMRLENKKLKEEMQSRQTGESAFNVFKPQPAAQGTDISRYTDPVSGNVDWNGYNNAVVQQAKAEASQTVAEHLDEQNARSLYPDVFANPDLEQAIAGQWFANKLQGKDVKVSDLAKKFSGVLGKQVSQAERKAEKKGAEQVLTELSTKEQASLQASSQNNVRQATSLEDEDRLKTQARYGDDNALASLMGKVAWQK